MDVIDTPVAFGPIYEDATYKYFAEAVPGSSLSAAVWRVSRMVIATTQIQWANVGDGNVPGFNNVFTNLAAAAALTYS